MSSTDIIIGSNDIFHYIPNLIELYSISSVNSKPQVASLDQANAPTCEELLCNTERSTHGGQHGNVIKPSGSHLTYQ